MDFIEPIIDFSLDQSFMLKLTQYRVKQYYADIAVLDFETENPLAHLEGKVVSGGINITANSPTRRAGSLKLLFDKDTYNLTDINNLISINKKIALTLGITNPFWNTSSSYSKYGEILYFKYGTYVILKATSTANNRGLSVSVSLRDKMAFLDGTCGGVFPASASLHEKIVFNAEGKRKTKYPLIKDMIKEVVHHFGGEHYSRIIVDDVPEKGRIALRYVGDTPINFATNKSETSPTGWERALGASFVIQDPPVPGYFDTYVKGEIVGFEETDLTFPGELVVNGGTNVAQALKTIASTLGDFEFYYDVEGIFHFQKKKNFIITGNTPLNLSPEEDAALQSLYCPRYAPNILLNEFSNGNLITNLTFNPNYSNIKNDFIYWGTKTKDQNKEVMVRYHLAIDERPKNVPLSEGFDRCSLCHREIYEVLSVINDGVLRYEMVGADGIPKVGNEEKLGKLVAPRLDTVFPFTDGFDWREELYRRALLAYSNSIEGSAYDDELIAEWRKIYDPTSTSDQGAESFQAQWEAKFGTDNEATKWKGYRVEAVIAPEKLRYWLDIIDTTSSLGQYSVKKIGRRSIVKVDNTINEVYHKPISDVVFVFMPTDKAKWEEKMDKIRKEYIPIGQPYALIEQEQQPYFKRHPSLGTCYEGVRSLLYEHLIYKSTISLTCVPILNLDAEKMIHLNLPEYGIAGDFIVNSVNFTIGNKPSMSVSLQEAFTIV